MSARRHPARKAREAAHTPHRPRDETQLFVAVPFDIHTDAARASAAVQLPTAAARASYPRLRGAAVHNPLPKELRFQHTVAQVCRTRRSRASSTTIRGAAAVAGEIFRNDSDGLASPRRAVRPRARRHRAIAAGRIPGDCLRRGTACGTPLSWPASAHGRGRCGYGNRACRRTMAVDSNTSLPSTCKRSRYGWDSRWRRSAIMRAQQQPDASAQARNGLDAHHAAGRAHRCHGFAANAPSTVLTASSGCSSMPRSSGASESTGRSARARPGFTD